MVVFFNGQFVPENEARVSIFDRGFLYGDGLFETIRVSKRRPFFWRDHWERFERGTKFLGISPPFSPEELLKFAQELIQRNNTFEAVLRFQLSRGVGARGYSPQSAKYPTLVMSVHPLEQRAKKWKLITSQFRTNPADPLSSLKTGNKLAQVLAKAEADVKGADEALLLSPDGLVAEGTSSNVFWIEDGTICTPPLNLGILPGITRAIVLQLCKELNIPIGECSCTPESLKTVAGLFLTLTSRGIVGVEEFEGVPIQGVPLVKTLMQSYEDFLLRGEESP